MRVTLATEPGTPGWPNEDFAAAAPGAAVLLDGASQFPRDADSGCVHGVAWYARTLGTGLLAEITAEPAIPLPQALARAIAGVRALHQDTCDLGHPATPAATVTALRLTPGGVEYLVISDSTIAADPGDGEPLIITDTRPPARADLATSDPAAAARACTGTIPLAGSARDRAAQRRRRPHHRPVRPAHLDRRARGDPGRRARRADPAGPRRRGQRPRRHPLAALQAAPTTPPSCTGTCPIEYPPRQSSDLSAIVCIAP